MQHLDQFAHLAHRQAVGVWIAIGVAVFVAMFGGMWVAFQGRSDPDE